MKKAKKNKSKFITLINWLCAISFIAVLLIVGYIYTGQLLCHIALGQIGELTNTNIKAGSIKYMANGSVVFTDLVVKPNKSNGINCEIIRAKRLFASFDPKSLILLKPRLDTIDVNDFLFNAVYDVNTSWSNLSELKIKPSSGSINKAPDIHLGSGILQYVKIVDGQEDVALSMPVDADFKSEDSSRKKYTFNITTATMSSGHGLSRLQGSWEPGLVTVTGGVASLSVPKFEMAWFINVSAAQLNYDKDENYSIALSIKDMQSLRNNEPNILDVDIPEFVEQYGFIAAIQRFLDSYKPKGLVDIDLKMSGNINEPEDSIIKGTVHCRDIAFTYSNFPYAIEHLTGDIDFTHDSITYDNLRGKHGDTELSFSGWCRNFGPERELQVNIKSDDMPLDDDLYKSLNERHRRFWSSFSPTGDITLDLRIERNPELGKVTNLKVGLQNVNAAYSEFPYPLKNLNGTLIFDPDKIVVQDAFSRDKKIELLINGGIYDRKKEDPPFSFIIDVNNIPMDSVLEDALLENQKKLYQSFQPIGVAKGSIRVSKDQEGEMTYSADMNFKNTSIKTDFLDERIEDISAKAIFAHNSAVVEEFTGTYGDMPVSLSGQFLSKQEQELCYDISLDMKKVRLDNKELQDLLPESIRQTVEQFDPNGEADMVIDLKKMKPEKPVDYSVSLNCLGNSIYFNDFNCPVSNVTGLMTIDSNIISLRNISASLGNNKSDDTSGLFTINGDILVEDGFMKQAELSVYADDILFNEKIMKIFSKNSLNLYQSLSPTGSINIDFGKFRIYNQHEGSKLVEFNGEIVMNDCEFQLSDKPAKLDSILLINGIYDTEKGFRKCKLIIDKGALNILGKDLTSLEAELNYDPNQQKWLSKYLLADLYEGKTTSQLELINKDNSPMEYILQTSFEKVNLEKFLSDANNTTVKNSEYTSGTMSGSMCLSSEIPQNKSRVGSCRVSIENMQIRKLSPLAKLLQVLNLNEPSDYTFDSMFIDSYIKRNGLIVEKLDMSGKNVAFYGSGMISLLDGDVDLSLIARGRRLATDDPSIIQSLTEGLGQAVIRMDVTGDYRNIKVVTKTLPVIEETFNILGKPIVEN